MGYEAFTGAQRIAIQNGQAAREEMRTTQDRNALSQATQAYVGGDTARARNALATSGRLDDVLALDRNTATTAATERTTRLADEDRAKATVLAGASGLLRLPEDQWLPTFTSTVAPRLLEVGIAQPMIDQIMADGISRQELESIVATLGGEVAEPKYLQGARGALDVIDPYSGELTNVRQAERESAPSGFRWKADGTGVEPIPGYVEGRSEVAGATRAPPRGRAGGGGSPRSSGGGASAARPAARPWERY